MRAATIALLRCGLSHGSACVAGRSIGGGGSELGRPTNLKVYEFTWKQICFCEPAPPGKPGSEPIVFHVENGVAWAARPAARQGLDKYSMVEKQFAFIRAELAKRPYRTEIEYDYDLGYPTRVNIDAKHIADAE